MKTCSTCGGEKKGRYKLLCISCYNKQPNMRLHYAEYYRRYLEKNRAQHNWRNNRAALRRNKEKVIKRLKKYQEMLPELNITFTI